MIPSLLQIPSAVSDSKLHSVLPNNGKGDFQFDRSTGATRINRDGLIEEVGYFSSELVQNGDFSELGSELVTNGDFATDSDWSKGTGWIINDGKAINTGGANFSDLTQSNTNVTIGKTYKITYTISDYTSGSIKFIMNNNSAAGVERNANGTYTDYISALSQGYSFRTQGSGFTGKIDNVSVKQVDPNDYWVLGTGSTKTDTLNIISTDGSLSFGKQQNVLEVGKTYQYSFDITSYTSGSLFFIEGSTNVLSALNATGTYSGVFTATGTDIEFKRGGVTNASFDNISVVEVQGDRPRLSYDITNGVVDSQPHLLLETSSTNLVTFSEDFTQWASTQVSLEKNYLAPDGLLNAVKITDNSVNSTHRVLLGTTSSSSGSFTYSIFLKKGTITNAVLNVFSSGTVAVGTIDLQNGTIVASGGGINAKIQNYGNDWYKCSVSGSLGSTSTTVYLYLSDTKNAYVGSGDFLYAYGAQLEELSYSTSYIPTAGTTITRAAETCNNSKPSVNSTEGVLYAEIAALADDNTFRMLSLSDGTNNNRVTLLYSNASDTIRGLISVSTSVQADLNSTNYDTTEFHKVAFKYKANDFSLYIDGQEVATDTSGSVFSANTLNNVSFVRGDNNNYFYGKVKGLAVYNEALSESQLMQLTGVTASSIYSNFVTRTASFTVEALNEVKKVIDNL